MSLDNIKSDLKALISEKNCGPIMIRLSWHDAGTYSNGKLTGGCPNAAMRFADGGESCWGANAGLNSVALRLLQPISDKYCPAVLSHADLWTLSANVSTECMGGPAIPTRFGRVDATSSADSVESQVGRLPDGDKGMDHLRDIFHPKGFTDRDIVALSGAHTVGAAHADRSGFDGAWTEAPLVFNNSYFTELLSKEYVPETTTKGNPQSRCPKTGTIMLVSDLALLESPFREYVELYAKDQSAFFKDYVNAWVKLQELGCVGLRDTL